MTQLAPQLYRRSYTTAYLQAAVKKAQEVLALAQAVQQMPAPNPRVLREAVAAAADLEARLRLAYDQLDEG